MIFNQNPFFIISGMVKYPEPKTTALGGVATGNIKAQEEAIVAPIINIKGCTSRDSAIEASTGKSIEVVATLEVISVRKFTAVTIKASNTIKCTPSSSVI